MTVMQADGAARVAPGVIEDADQFGFLCGWSQPEGATAPPVDAPLREVVVVVHEGTSTNLPRWTTAVTWLRNRYSAAPFELASVITESGPATDEVGSPSAALLVEATESMRWLGMQQQDLATYVGISASTIMSWKRDKPQHPRHSRIPALLSLSAAVAIARDELGEQEVLSLVWAHGTRGRTPGMPVEALTQSLVKAAEAASDAAWEADDGYAPGTAVMPSHDEILAGEAALHSELERSAQVHDER